MKRTITINRWEFDLINLAMALIALIIVFSLIFFLIPSLKDNIKDINAEKTSDNTSVSQNSNAIQQEALIIQVIDGDTFQINTGDYVRLIGINAPERTERYYDDSKLFLESLINNKSVLLEGDLDNRDNYGRLLKYAYSSDGLMINSELVRRGYAVPMEISPNLKYREKISNAYQQCINEKLRLCNI
ncbi:thermonuclease family protein [Candidatus Pacearchaeota archaeon]|nr:thermonuclease family protein [Candidatus Pacearchaeota archaeon]